MIESRDIVVGVVVDDDARSVSETSRKAAAQACWVAQRTRARVTLLHSTWSDVEGEGEPPSVVATEALKTAAEELGADGVRVGTAFTRERPWLALVQRALRKESDFVFVGRREMVDRDRLLGTNTEKLLRKCPSPVWAVAPGSDLLSHSILAATDLTEVGARVTRMGATLAAMAGAELHIVHAWQKTMQFQLECARLTDDAVERHIEGYEAELRERILQAMDGDQATVAPLLHVGCTSPDRAILEGVSALHPDLVVMGTLSRSGLPGVLVGNTAERVLDRIQCSLLAIKPQGFVSPVRS